VTLGHQVGPDDIHPHGDAIVRSWVPHEAVLPHAAVVVSHGGHGTALAALAAGVPIVCLPMGRDQHLVAERVEALGVGRAVPADAATAEVRAAVVDVLDTPGYRAAAQRLGDELRSLPGASLAADALEQLAAR
jgi:MGT family glycosyltransferase